MTRHVGRAVVALSAVMLSALAGPLIGVAAGPPATLDAIHGTPQSTAVNTIFQVRLVAYVRDADTNGVPGVTVMFVAPVSGASAHFSGSLTGTAVTDGSGLATAPILTANGQGGSFTLTATVPGVSMPATYSLTNTGGGGPPPAPPPPAQVPANLRLIGVGSSWPASVSAVSGTPQSTALNNSFATPLRAVVRDVSSSPVSEITVTFTAPASGASARFSGSATAQAITDGNGIATAPALTANGTTGTYVVTASVSGVGAPASFNLTNTTQPPPPPPPITMDWINVTPPGITLDPNGTAAGPGQNYGVMGVHADLSRPGTLYAAVCYQGLWKSTDYGLTWAKVIVTSGQSPMDNGRSAMRVAPDGSYLLTTSLYPINGVSNGAWKSLNGGQTWTRYNVGAPNGDDLGELFILPTDKNRVIAISHSPPHDMFESRDGGQTWTNQGQPGNTAPGEPIWIDANTLLSIGQGDADPNGPGTYRGVRSGSTWPWTWSWTHVDTQQHWHAVSQIFIDPNTGTIWSGGAFGIHKSTDNGATWTVVSGTYSAGIVGTATTLYSTANYASGGGFGPFLQHASRLTGGASWANDTGPAAMNNGWLNAAVVYDGSHYTIVAGNWLAGIWRLVEP